MLIPNGLSKLRGDKKQSEIAAIIGVTQTTYSMAETGQAVLPFEAFWKLRAYYDVPPETIYPVWILNGAYKIDAREKVKKPKTAVSVKIPIALAEEVDKLVANGEYLSRADFIVSAVRSALHG